MFNFTIFYYGPQILCFFPSKSLKIYHADYSLLLTTSEYWKAVKCTPWCFNAWRYFQSVLWSIIDLLKLQCPLLCEVLQRWQKFLNFSPWELSLKVVYIGNYEYRVTCLEDGYTPIITLFIMSFTKIFALKQNVLE